MRTIESEERRARVVRHHHLAGSATSVEQAATALVGFHSSDPASVFLSARARVTGCRPSDLEDALYERRSLVRILGMRRTMFVVPRELVPVIDEACTKSLAATERRRLVRIVEDAAIAPPGSGGRWVDRAIDKTMHALSARGSATARELTNDVPDLRERVAFGEGRRWAGTMGMSTRILFLLASEGRVVRGRPLGSWSSAQYRWAPTDAWLGAPQPAVDRATACAELLRRYLSAFGPATSTDIRWWTGWSAALVNRTLDAIGAIEVGLGHAVGYVVPGDDAVQALERSVALLPALDATVMGWKEREWYVAGHAGELFDRSGNAGPTIWADGRVVGAWSQTRAGEISVALLEPTDRATRRAIEAERRRLRAWLGDVTITPRFRTPLERRLADEDG